MCDCGSNTCCNQCAATAYWIRDYRAYCVKDGCCGCSECIYFTKSNDCYCGPTYRCEECGRPDKKFPVYPEYNPERWDRLLTEGAAYHAKKEREAEAAAARKAARRAQLAEHSPIEMDRLLIVLRITNNKQTAKKALVQIEEIYKTFSNAWSYIAMSDSEKYIDAQLQTKQTEARSIYASRRLKLRFLRFVTL
jgi:hypothetical protein